VKQNLPLHSIHRGTLKKEEKEYGEEGKNEGRKKSTPLAGEAQRKGIIAELHAKKPKYHVTGAFFAYQAKPLSSFIHRTNAKPGDRRGDRELPRKTTWREERKGQGGKRALSSIENKAYISETRKDTKKRKKEKREY